MSVTLALAEEPDDLKTAIESSEATKKEKDDGMQRATQIRIKQKYNCPEQETVPMRAPFLGFSVFVRFQSRARVHAIKIINADEIEKIMDGSLVPYS